MAEVYTTWEDFEKIVLGVTHKRNHRVVVYFELKHCKTSESMGKNLLWSAATCTIRYCSVCH